MKLQHAIAFLFTLGIGVQSAPVQGFAGSKCISIVFTRLIVWLPQKDTMAKREDADAAYLISYKDKRDDADAAYLISYKDKREDADAAYLISYKDKRDDADAAYLISYK